MSVKRFKRFNICILLLVSALMIFSSGRLEAGETVKVGLRYDTSTASIIQMRLGNDIPVLLPMYEPLVSSNSETGIREPDLAKSIEVVDNGQKLRIVLKQGHMFHTGEPVTAHDVKFSYEQYVHPSNGNLMAGPLDEIEEIIIIDDHTLEFKFWEPYASWKELLWVGICSKKYYEKVGAELFHKKPVGSGPFEFVERRIGESVTLKAAGNHWKGKVDFETLKFIVVPDDMSRLAMLETGELDLVYEIMPHQLRRLKKNKKVKIKSTSKFPSLIGLSIRAVTEPLMRDAKFKHAMFHAINRQEMVDKIFLGKGYPLYMYANTSELGYDPSIQFDFDIEKAKALLKESSYKPGTPLTLSYSTDIANSSLITASVQKYLQNIGITIKLQKLEAGTMATYARKQDKRYGAMGLFTWGGTRDPSLRMLLTFMSTSMYAAYPNRPNQKEFDSLVVAQSREVDVEKRKEILAKIHKIWVDDPGSVPLFGLDMIYAMRKRIEWNWTPYEPYPIHFQNLKIVK